MNRSIYKVKRLLLLCKEQGISGLLFRLKRRFAAEVAAAESPVAPLELSPDELQRVQHEIESLGDRAPLISVLLPVYNAPISFLRAAIDSVCAQSYHKWELCIADDASTDPRVRDLLEEYEKRDSRIKVVYRKENGHIAAASNSALEVATGSSIALLDHDDLLSPHALLHVIYFLRDKGERAVLYTDEAKIDEVGNVLEFARKPAWSPLYFYSYMYTGHLAVYPRELLHRAGGFRVGYEGSQDYDLMLRVLKEGAEVHHLPYVLYSWRSFSESVAEDRYSKLYAYQHALTSLREHLPALEPNFHEVEEGIYPGVYRVRYAVPEGFSVSRITLSESIDIEELVSLNVESDALFFTQPGLVERKSSSLSFMLEALQASSVEAVTPLLLQRGGRAIASAGHEIKRGSILPLFNGLSPYEGGAGMRIATGGEVPTATLSGLLISKAFWCEFIKASGRNAVDLSELEQLLAEYMLESDKRVYYCSRAVYLLNS